MPPERPPGGGYEIYPQAELERVLHEQREALEKEYNRARMRMEEADVDTRGGELTDELSELAGDRVNTFLDCAVAFRFLYPDKIGDLELGPELHKQISRFEGSVSAADEITYWANRKMLFGSTMMPLSFKRQQKSLEEYLATVFAEGSYDLYAEEAAKMSILNFQSRGRYRGDAKTFGKILHDFNHAKEMEADTYEVAKRACFMRILFPEKFGDIQLSDGFWQSAFSERYDEQAVYLWYLKVLAADDVKVTKEGLEITDKK